MQLSKLTAAEIRKYYETRLPALPRNATGEVSMRCPFHEDSTPSFGVDLERGFWKCHTGCGGGKIIDFEKRLMNCEDGEALENIAGILGQSLLPMFGGATTEATYQYFSEVGHLLFEVVKKRKADGKKYFAQRHRNESTGDWEWNLNGVRRVLYCVQNVLAAKEIIIVEGEKCVEKLGDALTDSNARSVAVTTNPGGAGKWLAEYSPYLTGKKVVIVPDNDIPGMKHAEQVAASVFPYAFGVKIVPLPVAEKGDIADFLQTNSLRDFLTLVKAAPVWKPAESEHRMFLPASHFERLVPEQIDWMVEGIIQRGANGFIVADPKGGKSFTIIDLCIALATGKPWLGFTVPRPTRTAYVSREDDAGLTGYRLRKLRAGRRVKLEAMDEYFYLNSRQQTKVLMLDEPDQLQELIGNVKALKAEMVFLDVFNVLHAAKENDNTEMRGVLNHVHRLQAETGAACCLVHHWSKGGPGASVTQRLRGASAIAGFAEFTIGITPDAQKQIRMMEFDLKVDSAPDPVYYRIQDYDYSGNPVPRKGYSAELVLCDGRDFKLPGVTEEGFIPRSK